MNDESLTLLLKIVGFAGFIALLYYFFRKKKPLDPGSNPAHRRKNSGLRTRACLRKWPENRLTEYQSAMKSQAEKGIHHHGKRLDRFRGILRFHQPIDISSIALIGFGAVQIVTGLLIKTDKQ